MPESIKNHVRDITASQELRTGTLPQNPSRVSSPLRKGFQPDKYGLLRQTVGFSKQPQEPKKDDSSKEPVKEALTKEGIKHYKDALQARKEGDEETAQKHGAAGEKAVKRIEKIEKEEKEK